MACAGALYHGTVVWPRADHANQFVELERYLYASSTSGSVYRFHVRPIPYALARWSGCQHILGFRYALSD